MQEKPRPPQLNDENAAAFQLESVVAVYHTRPVYPAVVAPFLVGLMAPGSRFVLELGCGTGEIARSLAPLVERVDAVDISEPMIRTARDMPGGGHAAIRWIVGRAEEFPAAQEYALAVAGDSLHWMDWDILLPRLARELAPGAPLVIASVAHLSAPWYDELRALIVRLSTARDWQEYDLVELLESRALFRLSGSTEFPPMQVKQAVDDYVESFHARAGLARERMGPGAAADFDTALRAAVDPYVTEGRLSLQIGARLRWGAPLAGRGSSIAAAPHVP
jgi:SAM-dependent methyltransferase